ncbi:hypothetical protein E1B28_006428 [Marasmius oreades]|uniref:Uncharacterized protein n=1 Tax=Marasmius oreades TaxID=181124 RepID=A0A9P7S5L5_9AGAR|nr:uncharacterized protein E1B28_006428 [Marasmius oreades]KAG7095715.1 hypothetical protein E1B28_006428 [Marasmius oreades]
MFFYGFFFFSLLAATSFATPVSNVPGTATLGDLTQNDCNIEVKPGALAFLVSPKSDFVEAKPGATAAESGMCGRSDGDVIVMNAAGTVLASLSNFPEVLPVGFCNECGPNDVIVNQAIFDALKGNPNEKIIKNVFVTIA